ncbi:MAG: hypothetical protein ABI321_16795 [Polyangia bacterium]
MTVLVAGCGAGKKPGKNVSVGSPQVRACEILLEDGSQPVESVTFGPQVKGTMQRWAPKTSVAFVAVADAPIVGPVLTVESTSKPSFTVSTISCYDHEGKPVAAPDVHL